MGRALAFGVGEPDTVVVALAGFLARGGIFLLALPSLVLPSVIGLAGVTGIDAFGIDGRPTAWLYEMVAIVIGAVVVWLALASLIGSLIDLWLIEAALDANGRPVGQGRPLPRIGLLMDIVAVRGICLLPLAGALAWASTRIYTAAYNELTTPSNLSTPLPVRVVENAADAVILVAVGWLVTETIAAIAVRRLVLSDGGVGRAIAGALAQTVRRTAFNSDDRAGIDRRERARHGRSSRRHGHGLRLVPHLGQEPGADRGHPRPWPVEHQSRLPTGPVHPDRPDSRPRLAGGSGPVRSGFGLPKRGLDRRGRGSHARCPNRPWPS